MRLRPGILSLSTRLTIVIVIVGALAFAASFAVVLTQVTNSLEKQGRELEQISDRKLAEELESGAALAGARLEVLRAEMGRRVNAMARSADARNAIASFNVVAIADVLEPAARNADIDYVLVIDTKLAPLGDSKNSIGLVGFSHRLGQSALGQEIRSFLGEAHVGTSRQLNEVLAVNSDLRGIFQLSPSDKVILVVVEPLYGEFGETTGAMIAMRRLRPVEPTLAAFVELNRTAVTVSLGNQRVSSAGEVSSTGLVSPSDMSRVWRTADQTQIGACVPTLRILSVCALEPIRELYVARDELIRLGTAEGAVMGRRLLLAGILSVLFFALVTVATARRISAPLARITAAVKAVARGEYGDRVREAGRSDEVGDIARAVISLQDSMRERDMLRGDVERQNLLLVAQESELRRRNVLFEAALDNMSHGLCMFDGDGRLIVSNRRFAELYRLAPEAVVPGMTADDLAQLQEHLLRPGGESHEDGETFIREIEQSGVQLRYLLDGRIIAIDREPMGNGGWLALHEDVTERKRNEARIVQMATRDGLTGLPNRLMLRERMDTELERVRRGGGGFAVLCLDLDEFKSVNDTLGHPSGDSLLRQVAFRLLSCAQPHDLVARLGGDEFALILVGRGGRVEIEHFAQVVIEELSRPYVLEGQEVLVGTSIGIAMAPVDGTDPDELLKRADLALYRAKSDGKGTFRCFEPRLEETIRQRREMIHELHLALSRGELDTYFQPQVSFSTNRLTGFEALLRWHQPQRGMVPPEEFIQLAEETGLILQIGEWVLHQACKVAASWPVPLKIAVNVSARQLRSTNFARVVADALTSSGLDASRLELEVTETALLNDDAETRGSLLAVKSMGVRIAMDDFGTGYSSLSCLRSFPFDKIKIDQSFVRTMEASTQSQAIVSAILDLARNLRISTTAEGVETLPIAELLRAGGCDDAQGFLFGPAQPAAAALALIQGGPYAPTRLAPVRPTNMRGLSRG